MHGKQATRVKAFSLIVCGTITLGLVGFLHNIEVHNAFHDARHLFAFPCH